MDYTPENLDRNVLLALAGLAAIHNSNSCFPSQETLLWILQEKYGRAMCRATLARHLRGWYLLGYLDKKMNHVKRGTKQWDFHSTTWYITTKARTWLSSIGEALWGKTVDKLRDWLLLGCLKTETIVVDCSINYLYNCDAARWHPPPTGAIRAASALINR